MSSRDPYNRSGKERTPDSGEVPAPTGKEPATPRDRFFNVDPADIDRYLSGRPARTGTNQEGSRSSGKGSDTASQLAQLQQSVNRASRGKSPSTSRSSSPVDTGSFGDPEPDADARGSTSQTAYASQESSRRANQRRSVMREDPYVSATDYDDPVDAWSDDAFRDDSRFAADSLPEVDHEAYEPVAPAPRRRAPRSTVQRPSLRRPTVPTAIARADVMNDTSALVFIGLSCLSLALMAIIVTNRIGSLPETVATHVSASGVLEHYASRSTLWQLPLMATMLTLMNLVAAWFISPLDRFASRFLLASSLVVQFVTWVAVFRLLW